MKRGTLPTDWRHGAHPPEAVYALAAARRAAGREDDRQPRAVVTVLVVDDRAINRDLVRRVLDGRGHRVLEADGGRRALDLMRAELPALVVTDVLMPDMDGYDFVRALRTDPVTRAVPVVFYTANYLEADIAPMAAELGVHHIVTKTGDVAMLLEAVESALAAGSAPVPAAAVEEFDRTHLRLVNRTLLEKVRELEGKERLRQLLDATIAVSENLDLAATLQRVVEAARILVDARYAALWLTDEDGELLEPPCESGDGSRSATGSVRDLLGLAIGVENDRTAELYLVARDGVRFDAHDSEQLMSLVATASTAIVNSRRYEESRRREEWLAASAEITSALLAADADEALELVVRGARRVSTARVAWIEVWEAEGHGVVVGACDGPGCPDLCGRVLAEENAPLFPLVAESREPVLIGDARLDLRADRSECLRLLDVGPVLVLPLVASGSFLGALLIANGTGEPPFSPLDVQMAVAFAGHAALALEFSRAESDRRRLTVVEDRNRIARDLHDVVIQRLFAVGLRLEGMQRAVSAPVAARLAAATLDLDGTIYDIRNAIFSLRGDGSPGPTLHAQLVRLAEEARVALGFAPRLRVLGAIDAVVPDAIYTDVLATVREALSNTARHADAGAAEVLVSVAQGELTVRVTDDGRGLPADRRESGLANLRHRAQALGGSMSTQKPLGGRGLVLTWRVTLDPTRRSAPGTGGT